MYYLPGTTGWGATFGGAPTAPWIVSSPLILLNGPSLGAQGNTFGFTISCATNLSVVVQACADLANPVWVPLATNMLINGSSSFSDPDRNTIPCRFYRVSSP